MSGDAVPDLTEVHILGLPVEILARAEEHVDGLLREFALIAASEAHGEEVHLPRQLLDLVHELERDYAAMTEEQQSRIAAAADTGLDSVDVVYRVPAEVAGACVRLGDALDAADRFCRDGKYLLNLATPPDAQAFRRWYLGEFVRQIEGQERRSWPQWAAEHGVPEVAHPED